MRKPLRAHVGGGAFCRFHVRARFDVGDRPDHGRTRFVGVRLGALHAGVKRRDLLIDLKQFAARPGGFCF